MSEQPKTIEEELAQLRTERDEAVEALQQLRGAWNAHMELCVLPLISDLFDKIQIWKSLQIPPGILMPDDLPDEAKKKSTDG